MAAIDLGFVRSDTSIANQLSLPAYYRGYEFGHNTPLIIVGGMATDVFPCTYDGPFASSPNQSAFDGAAIADLDVSRLGIVALPTPYAPSDYDGNSGSGVWGRLNGVYACQGFLVGVSEEQPFGLIVRLRDAMAKLGIIDYEVL